VKDKKTAYEIWRVLTNSFEKELKKKVACNEVHHICGNSHSFLQFDIFVHELCFTGATPEETDIICHLLLTMLAYYDVVVTGGSIICREVNVEFYQESSSR
jgi:hypothetical protein